MQIVTGIMFLHNVTETVMEITLWHNEIVMENVIQCNITEIVTEILTEWSWQWQRQPFYVNNTSVVDKHLLIFSLIGS